MNPRNAHKPARACLSLSKTSSMLFSNAAFWRTDLCACIGDIIGGSQREERLDLLSVRMTQAGLDTSHYNWYLDLRRYGSVPHAGFGLGFERTVAYATGLSNVRDVIPFPRTPGNARY